jgi:hypothetical protein
MVTKWNARLWVLALGVCGSAAAEVTVHYYNMAGISSKAMLDAVRTADETFRSVGVQVRWVDCLAVAASGTGRCTGSSGPMVFEMRITDTKERSIASPTLVTMGEALLVPGGGSVYAKVFVPRVMAWAKHLDVPVSRVLGYSIAHELGHLLMERGTHSNFGIMRAQWGRGERVHISAGRLQFDGFDARRIRSRIAEVR